MLPQYQMACYLYLDVTRYFEQNVQSVKGSNAHMDI